MRLIRTISFILSLVLLFFSMTLLTGCMSTNGNYAAYVKSRKLTTFEIPEGTTQINTNAFKNCESLVSITIPSSVNYIGEHAFDGCTNLREVHINDIAAWCNIEFQSTGSGIGNPLQSANLYVNGDLVTELVIPNNVTKIGNYAFYGYDALTSVIIPSNVKSIGESAFSTCKNLSSVTLTEGLITINHNAFTNCKKLTKIIIPNSVTTIYGGDVLDEPFFGCDKLTVYCRAKIEPYGWTGNWDVYSHRNYGKENVKLKVVWGYEGN